MLRAVLCYAALQAENNRLRDQALKDGHKLRQLANSLAGALCALLCCAVLCLCCPELMLLVGACSLSSR